MWLWHTKSKYQGEELLGVIERAKEHSSWEWEKIDLIKKCL